MKCNYKSICNPPVLQDQEALELSNRFDACGSCVEAKNLTWPKCQCISMSTFLTREVDGVVLHQNQTWHSSACLDCEQP